MHTHLQTFHHSSPRCIMGLFCGDVGLFRGYTFIRTHVSRLDVYKDSRTYTVYRHDIIKTTCIHTYHIYIYIYTYMWIYIFEWGDSNMNVPAVRCRIPDGSSRKRRWRVRRTRRRSAARHVITPRQCTYSGRGDGGLFCWYTGLFCSDVGLVYGDTGLFCGGVGLFCGIGLLRTSTRSLTTPRPRVPQGFWHWCRALL